MNYRSFKNILYLIGCSQFLLYGGLDDFLVDHFFNGSAIAYPFVACLIVGVGYSSFLLWWELIDKIFGVLSPMIPGYCYTCFFESSNRAEAAWRLGYEPRWVNIQRLPGVMETELFNYNHTLDCEVMHVYPCKTGKTVKELHRELRMFRCGGRNKLVFNPFYFLIYLHQFARCSIWFVAIWNLSYPMMLAIMVATGFVNQFGFNFMTMGAILIAFVVNGVGVLQKCGMITAFLLAGQVINKVAMGFMRRQWNAGGDEEPPEPGLFPLGVGPSNRVHSYNWQDKNPNYTTTYFQEDGGVTGDERELFMRQTGLVNTETRKTGNPHRVAAQFARYFKWHWANQDRGGTDLTLNIGGTFRGWPCTVAGVSLQPEFGDSDTAHLKSYGSSPGRGQMVIDDWLATNCGPVGGGPTDWNPKFGVEGIGGATLWMAHCYDVPIKSVIGVAHENNTEICYINLHGCPAVFSDTNGILPLSKQSWVHCPDGYTEWKWANDTSGRTWRHNTRLYYEHFFTDYIQTDDRTWYVSDIYRQVGDLYLIRWSRTKVKPVRTPVRQISVKIPQGLTNIPVYRIKHWFGFQLTTIEFIQSLKTFEEYVHTSKSFDSLQQNLRALTDNYHRQKGMEMDFLNHSDVIGIWKAEMLRRNLVELNMNVDEQVSFKDLIFRLLGFQIDSKVIASVLDEVLELLKRQPIREISRDTLVQDKPYVTCERLKPIVKRTTPLPKFQGDGQSLVMSQEWLDKEPPVDVMELSSQSETIQRKICHCIFGRDRTIGPILPCGNPEKGGSYLNSDTTKLLLTEIEYLIQNAHLALIIDTKSEEDGISCVTQVEDEEVRKVIVRIFRTDDDNWNATRIHYGPKTSYRRVMTVYEVDKYADLIDAIPLIEEILNYTSNNVELVNREYVPDPKGEELWRVERERKILDKINKQNNHVIIDNLRNALRNQEIGEEQDPEEADQDPNPDNNQRIRAMDGPYEFQMLDFEQVTGYGNIPVLINNDPWCKQYDKANWIDGCQYPPAHYYAASNVTFMRKLKKPD